MAVECVGDSLWCYQPNKPAAYAFLVMYFISCVTHIIQTIRYKGKYTIPLVTGTAFTTIGFAFKIWSSYQPNLLGPWITAVILLFTAPPIYAAADYFIFAKTLHYIPSQAPMHPSRVATTFVAADVICEMLMGTGVGQIVNYDNPTKVRIGGGLIKTGLLLQVIMFFLFIAVIIKFHRNIINAGLVGRSITVLYVLYASSFLISVRCIYRIIEYFEGTEGKIYRTEVYFHVFESSIMFLNVIILNIWHPGRYLPRSNKVYLNEHGQEVTSDRGGWEDPRPFLVTLVDPFDLGGMTKRWKARRAAAKNGKDVTFTEKSSEPVTSSPTPVATGTASMV